MDRRAFAVQGNLHLAAARQRSAVRACETISSLHFAVAKAA
jgi:hypothetical protein